MTAAVALSLQMSEDSDFDSVRGLRSCFARRVPSEAAAQPGRELRARGERPLQLRPQRRIEREPPRDPAPGK